MVLAKKQTSIAIFKGKATVYCIQTLNLLGVTSLSHMHPFSIKIIWDYLNLGSYAQKEPSFQKNTLLSHSVLTQFLPSNLALITEITRLYMRLL